MRSYKAVVFDLDGTLIDSHIDFEKMTRVVRDYLLEEGLPIEALDSRRKVYLIIRGGENVLLEHGVKRDSVQDMLDFMTEAMNKIELEAIDTIQPKPNALEILDALSRGGLALGIATRSHRVYAERCLRKTGMGRYIQGLLARDDVQYAKPDPRHLLQTIELLNVNPDRVLYVGDTTTDLETAHAANVDFIGFKRNEVWGKRLMEAGCEVMVEDLGEVARIALGGR